MRLGGKNAGADNNKSDELHTNHEILKVHRMNSSPDNICSRGGRLVVGGIAASLPPTLNASKDHNWWFRVYYLGQSCRRCSGPRRSVPGSVYIQYLALCPYVCPYTRLTLLSWPHLSVSRCSVSVSLSMLSVPATTYLPLLTLDIYSGFHVYTFVPPLCCVEAWCGCEHRAGAMLNESETR